MKKISFLTIVRVLLVGTLAVLPLIVMPFVLYPFVFGKTLFFEFMVLLTLGPFLALCLTSKPMRERVFTILKHPLTIVMGIVLLVQWISSLAGVDLDRSIWGDEERGMGLVVVTFAFVYFVMLRSVVSTRRQAFSMITTLVISGLVTSAFALARYFGITIFGVDTGYRISGTVANPIFFAGMLLFYLGFGVAGFFETRTMWWRIFFAVSTVVQLVVLTLTKTRGTTLALIVALALLLCIIAVRHKGLWRTITITVMSFGLVAVIAFVLFRNTLLHTQNSFIVRFASISIQDETLQSRFGAWVSGIRAFEERPILGWGVENFAPAFDAHYNPELLRAGFGETNFDRAHNVIVETLVEGGALGLIIFLATTAYLYFWIWRRSVLSYTSRLIITTTFTAYFLHLLLAFDTVLSVLLMYALLVYATIHEGEEFSLSLRRSDVVASAVGFAVMIPLMWVMVIQPLQQNNALLHAVVYSADYDKLKSVPMFELPVAMPTPYPEEAKVEYVKNITRLLDSKKVLDPNILAPLVARADELLHENIAKHPADSYNYFLLGTMYKTGFYIDPKKYFATAIEYFNEALVHSPKRQLYHFGIADVYSLQEQFDKSLVEYKKAFDDAPDVTLTEWNYLVTLVTLKRTAEADPLMLALAEHHFVAPTKEENLLLAHTMDRLGRTDLSVQYYSDVAENNPGSASDWASFATALAVVGKYGDARFAALYAASIDHSFESEAARFIAELPNEGKGSPLTTYCTEHFAQLTHYVAP